MTSRLLATLLLSLLVLPSCGYRLVDGRGSLGVDFERIEIRAFENQSTQPGLERMLLSALTEEFARRDWLTPVVAGQDAPADLVMKGVVEQVRVRPSSYSSVALSIEERLEVHVDVSVRRAASDEVIWQHPGLRATELFLTSPEPQVYETNKEQALRRVSALLSERIHDELFQRF